MSDHFHLSLVQHDSTLGQIDKSLARFANYAKLASERGSDLLLFPECSLSGYNNTLELNQKLAEPVDGPSAQVVAALCQQHDLAIAYGFVERSGSSLYNSVQLVGKTGEPLALYRKTHLWGELDRELFTAGDALQPVVEIDGWKIGLIICYDVEFPETVRQLALSGADIVLVPTALMSSFTTIADMVVNVRAFENQLFIAYANYCGSEHDLAYIGHSCIVGPDGINLAKASTDEVMLSAALHRSAIVDNRASLPYFDDRRPGLYRSLTV